ncbi:Carbonic anhydrase-related protein 10 [Frankliniella fusca]|uniref:Carbonic anhydrase-related protein 10 n=1 Tax=Frankliniella fusca TaxID=407009 RepID=A0AAE1LMA5_9NEOP|nr:Carbonic anhydrase-related protein 10 [Frankliniella fusca]
MATAVVPRGTPLTCWGLRTALCTLLLLLQVGGFSGVIWEEWWTYDGISGPAFWGLINPEWSLCNKGHRQSPVDLDPERLLFDPNLRHIRVNSHRVNGLLTNTGHGAVLALDNSTRRALNVSGGPLAYKYQLHELHVRYGLVDALGSEHLVSGRAFPAEIQIFGFNSELYVNFSDATQKAQGLVALSVGDLSNPELRLLTDQLDRVQYRGDSVPVTRISIHGLLPNTSAYMTYDGSTTMPGCHETVTWIVFNKPIYITKQQLLALRRLMQGTMATPKAPLGNNFRGPQSLHNRPLRTNIDFRKDSVTGNQCVSMKRTTFYKGWCSSN